MHCLHLSRTKWLIALAACASSLLPNAARAALGDNAASVQADSLRMKAAIQTQAAPAYVVHELSLPGGGVLREFVSASNKVFAVAWSGPFMPDLRQALGVYFAPYRAAAAVEHTGHSRMSVVQPTLVVHCAGHARAFYGQAYLPLELPAGVTPQELR